MSSSISHPKACFQNNVRATRRTTKVDLHVTNQRLGDAEREATDFVLRLVRLTPPRCRSSGAIIRIDASKRSLPIDAQAATKGDR